METGWLRKSQWLKHKEDNPNCFMDWESFKRIWLTSCKKGDSLQQIREAAKRIANKIERKKNDQTNWR